MVDRARPTRSATSSWVSPNSSISWRYASADSIAIEVGALQVLDEGELQLVAIGELPDDGRDTLEAGRDRGSQPTLPGDELVPVEDLGHEDRLDDAVFGHARGERGELVRIPGASRLVRVRADPPGRDLEDAGWRRRVAAG